MNAKQLAALVLVLGIVLLVQFALSLRNRATASAAEAEAAEAELSKLETLLGAEKSTFADNENNSRDLIKYIGKWRPYFEVMEKQLAVESFISMKVREDNILNISQRYEQVAHNINNKPNDSLPMLVRASLVFDDNYAKVINWTGKMESIKPTMRVSRASMARGSRPGDVRLDLILEIPLMVKKE